MALSPGIGGEGGPHYDVARAIKSFLGQMAEGGIILGAAVIKELMQNADDAEATELSVLLDERNVPQEFNLTFKRLLFPALLVRNNAPFRQDNEVGKGEVGDFTALCEVARGHKRFQATAAGRFGIGFNSVYFFTDTPVIFSRREVHIFDPAHCIFGKNENGWRFDLDEFPKNKNASSAGPIKAVLDWALPKASLKSNQSFEEIAMSGNDYRQALLRLPLREAIEGSQSLYQDCFPEAQNRRQLLKQMYKQASRAILFLKHLERIEFGILNKEGIDILYQIEITPNPDEFTYFVDKLQERARDFGLAKDPLECEFYKRIITSKSSENGFKEESWSFHVKHRTSFDQRKIVELRQRLAKNEERAVPWVSLAIPSNPESLRFDEDGTPAWRVFLPLLEKGPCGCVFNGAFFVGPSRQRAEFRRDGSDEALRKTEWNRSLIEHALVPMLRDASLELTEWIPELIKQHPQDYLSLFPIAHRSPNPEELSQFLQHVFSRESWCLKCYDIWDQEFELWVEKRQQEGQEGMTLEMISQPLVVYRNRFRILANKNHKFIHWTLGSAIQNRLGEHSGIQVERSESVDVLRAILGWEEGPKAGDLTDLIRRLSRRVGQDKFAKKELENLWALQKSGNEELLRYDEEMLYMLVGNKGTTEIHNILKDLGLDFEATQWVDAACGLPALEAFFRRDFDNLMTADDRAALELLRKVKEGDQHDRVKQDKKVAPVIDFLCTREPASLPDDLKLGFLVKTATNKHLARHLGVIFLKPTRPTTDDEAVWEGLLRRTFAEIDPGFAPHIQRLIDHAPKIISCLHASDCEVKIAKAGHLLDILHHALKVSNEACSLFREELNRRNKGKKECRPEAYRTARIVLEEAIDRWENLDDSQRLTVLVLPIHRAADGSLVSLEDVDTTEQIEEDTLESVIEGVKERFYLQSEDDLQDAPISLPERRLLRSEKATCAFYKQQLRIDSRNRRVVVAECLRQIGGEDIDSWKLLAYIAKYYADMVATLLQDGSPIAIEESQELRDLFNTARLVPCLDDTWQPFDQCVQAQDIAEALTKQGWKGQELDRLLSKLAYPCSVAMYDKNLTKLIHQLYIELASMTVYDIPGRAIGSEDPSFTLEERAGVIAKNRDVLRHVVIKKASVIDAMKCRTLSGTATFKTLELIDVTNLELPLSVQQPLFPNAVDVSSLSREWKLSEKDIRDVLKLFDISVCGQQTVDTRIVEKFAELWPDLEDGDRFALLKYVGSRQDLGAQVGELVEDMDVVFVGGGKGSWTLPEGILTPQWALTNPPNLPPDRLPKLTGVDAEIKALWNNWCDLKKIGQVVEVVVLETVKVPEKEQKRAWQALTAWLDKVAEGSNRKSVIETLNNLRWILARKGKETEFRVSAQTINHPGSSILSREFWVVEGTLPKSIVRDLEFEKLSAAQETVLRIASCFSEAIKFQPKEVESVYKIATDLIDQNEELKEVWCQFAKTEPVYRLFRNRDRMVSGQELFLGNREHMKDYNDALFCLSDREGEDDGFIKRIKALYRKLGVADSPSDSQAVFALSRLKGKARVQEQLYERLVNLLMRTEPKQDQIDETEVRNMKILACSDTYEPLSGTYRDKNLNRARLLSEKSRYFVINDRHETTKRVVSWLEKAAPRAIQELGEASFIKLVRVPEKAEIESSASLIIGPWEDWFDQLASDGSEIRERVSELLQVEPSDRIYRLIPVESMEVKYILPNGSEVIPSSEWEGPTALSDSEENIFVFRRVLEKDYLGREDELEELDQAIAAQVLCLLAEDTDDRDAFWEHIQETLERPNVILDRMRKSRQESFFHQYNDQTADPDFAKLFDTYLRTARNAREKRRELEQKMFDIIQVRFVQERRNQIRGYGYDEFSIFAELIQNAEDAYLQRINLVLEAPPRKDIAFRYLTGEDGSRCLVVEHYGRPFNYWRHGSRRIESYGRDVEGVLKSAGSFKPHGVAQEGGEHTVGRFGLGFKSVYLITDRPRIHSGQWHFEIESGCIPRPVPIPEDLPKGATRIVLPLTDEAEEEPEGNRLVTLMPFLREIYEVTLANSDGSKTLKTTVINHLPEVYDGVYAELVKISGVDYWRDGAVQVLRLRHSSGTQQLGIYITPNGLPSSWNDVFDRDTFAVLPLNVHLGCGIGISHLFELQSGRTHLIDPEGNRPRFKEVADLLQGIPHALRLCLDEASDFNSVVSRFWALWRWDGGDQEARELRQRLATVLVEVSRTSPIVPTLDPSTCIALDGRPAFLFRDIPIEFAGQLIQESVTVSFRDGSIALSNKNVIPESFGKIYQQTCRAAGVETKGFQEVGWRDIGETMVGKGWFFKQPDLLSAMARCIDEHDFEKIKDWLQICPLRAADGSESMARDLLPWNFPGYQYLPEKRMRRIHKDYDQHAVDLLKRVGMHSRPPIEEVERWILEGLPADECVNMLRYFAGEGRWRRDFYNRLDGLLQQSWFESEGGRITTNQAWNTGLIPEEVLEDRLFRVWLGILAIIEEEVKKDVLSARQLPDPKAVLKDIYAWWAGEGEEYTARYEAQTYPNGAVPPIQSPFYGRDRDQRQGWMTLFLLGCMHTMGRTIPDQHRSFLLMCERRGWLRIFTEENAPAGEWMRILEEYLDEQADEAEYYHWMRQFVSMFQISHWLNAYVETFLGIQRRRKPFSLDQITRPRTDADLGGGGPDGPPITRPLGIGACFIMRELRRKRILTNQLADRHCYVPVQRVRNIFSELQCIGIEFESRITASTMIYNFLVKHLGKERATFNDSFDLPFLAIADDSNLWQRFLKSHAFGSPFV